MKRIIFLGLILTVALAMLSASCGQTGSNNSAMNMNGMNHNTMINSNSSMNMSRMNQNSTPMNSNMNHSEMKSSPNAASQPYDLQFIDTMTAHHQGAVEMAKMVDGKTNNTDIIKFAKQIISGQEKEISRMKEWREKWFKDKPPAMNMEMPGMADSMKMDMSKLSNSKDKEFDLAFIEMMTPHHEGAVIMAKEALSKSEKPEVKTLAGQIIKAQEAEIKMMNEWKTKWSK
jgi:uncharacterized protein (DUF305 family)